MIVEHKFYIGIRDVDRNNYITDKGIFAGLEDISGIHSSIAGYGLLDMEKTQKFWMVISWHLEVIKRPKFGDTITIHTWSKFCKKLFAYRDFEIFDEKGELIATAGSKWVLVNRINNCVEKVSDEVLEKYEGESEKSSTDISLLDKLKEPKEYSNIIKYEIRREMIDINGHVHNLNYLDLARFAFPENIYEKEFSKIDIMYKKEIKLGEIVKCCYSNEGNIHIVAIKSEDEKVLHAILKFED